MFVPHFERTPYFALVVCGIVAGFISAAILMRRAKVEKETILLSTLLTAICTIFCSVVAARLRAPDATGFSFDGLGAAFGLMLGAGVSGFVYRRDFEVIVSSVALSAPLMYAIAKIGCHFAGCCKGMIYGGLLAIRYEQFGDAQYFPIQLLESVVFAALFVGLLVFYSKIERMWFVKIAIITSLAMKFLLDFLRDTHAHSLLSLNQVTILVFLAGYIVFNCLVGRKMRNSINK